MPSGPKLAVDDYYRAMASTEYVLSPNGDRPDCYRHYEALLLGAIPIVSWQMRWLPGVHPWFQGVGNMTALERGLPLYRLPSPDVAYPKYWQGVLSTAECRTGRVEACGGP